MFLQIYVTNQCNLNWLMCYVIGYKYLPSRWTMTILWSCRSITHCYDSFGIWLPLCISMCVKQTLLVWCLSQILVMSMMSEGTSDIHGCLPCALTIFRAWNETYHMFVIRVGYIQHGTYHVLFRPLWLLLCNLTCCRWINCLLSDMLNFLALESKLGLASLMKGFVGGYVWFIVGCWIFI